METDVAIYFGIGVAAAIAVAAGILFAIRRHCGKNWAQLAERYPGSKEPAGKHFTRHTVKLGSDVCRQCVTVVVADQGLYLRSNGFLSRRPAVLIPWDEFRDVTEGKLELNKAAVLTVGDAATKLVMPMRLYDRVRSYMPGQLRRRV